MSELFLGEKGGCFMHCFVLNAGDLGLWGNVVVHHGVGAGLGV